MRIGGRAGIVLAVAGSLVAAVLAGCRGSGQAANPRSPRAYLDHALQLIEQHALYSPARGWSAVDAEARKMAAGAKTPRGTYPAIRYVIQRLVDAGDLHAAFFDPAEAKRHAPGAPLLEAASPPPTVSLLAGRLGLIKLPGISSLANSPNSRHYSLVALTAIERLVAGRHPCGWVVDLREDTGGNIAPMLLSVGPIVGKGDLIAFSGKRGFESFSYRQGALSGAGETYRAPLTVPDLVPPPPVAILTRWKTASAGEVVAVAFRGRAQTRSFGAATAGATTAPGRFRLADGAEIRLALSYYVDRNHVVYKHALQPDVDVPLFGSPGDPQMRAAAAWLLARPGCTK